MSSLSIAATLRAATAALAVLPDVNPRLEAELLLAHVSGWSRTTFVAWPEREVAASVAAAFAALLQQRVNGAPIAYLRGRQAFWTLDLAVSPATLIPRADTELLVETALAQLPATALRVADLGTGSGAIAAALASERPQWWLLAVERSAAALQLARANFRTYALHNVATLRGEWLTAGATASFDAIVSNPPYLAAADPHLQRGDLRFEPLTALAAGDDGLSAIRALLPDACRCLRPGGLLALEHGCEQGAAVRQLLAAQGLQVIETRRDLAGLERVTLGYRAALSNDPSASAVNSRASTTASSRPFAAG